MVEIAPHQYVNRKSFACGNASTMGTNRAKRPQRRQNEPKPLDGDMIAGPFRTGLATAERETMKAGGKTITEAGRRAIEG